MKGIEKDYEYCERVIQKHSKSFYFAFKDLEDSDRKAVYAIYALCRLCDDTVDEESGDSKVALEGLTTEIEAFIAGEVPDHPVFRALDDVRSRYELDYESIRDQLKGQGMDLEFKQPNNIEDLDLYSDRVAGSVGRMLLPILSDKNTYELKLSASNLGVAMQYTNILRDIGEDYRELSRIYIPKESMEAFDYTESDLKEKIIDTRFIEMWESLATRAEKKYQEFLEDVQYFKPSAQTPLVLSLFVYRDILNAVRKSDYDCLSKRNHISNFRKLRYKKLAEEYVQKLHAGGVE